MKLISYDSVKAVQFFIMEEIRPLHGLHPASLHEAVAQRYGFVIQTPDLAQAATSGMKFAQGTLASGDRNIVILELHIYNDGVLVSCPTSDDVDTVLDDLMRWAATAIGLRPSQTAQPRRYTSFLTVELDQVPDARLDRFAATQRALSDAIRATFGEELTFGLQRIGLAPDPASAGPPPHAPFFIERRVGVPYARNRFWSGAPLKTGAHLHVLETFEAELAA